MYIGELAKTAGVTRKAIRHYEAIGLLPAPGRRGRYRDYGAEYLHWIDMIRTLHAGGFTLAEMREIAAIKVGTGRFPLALAQERFKQKAAVLHAQIRDLESRERRLMEIKTELDARYGNADFTERCA